MQTVYYNLMRNLVALVVLGTASLCAVAQNATQEAPKTAPMKAQFTDTHEGMTIGVEPWTHASEYKEKFPKRSPFSGGVVALLAMIEPEEVARVFPVIRDELAPDQVSRRALGLSGLIALGPLSGRLEASGASTPGA